MRYNLESTLPVNAFSPRGGRGPFSRGMTLEGGGGGGFLGAVTNPISKALGTDGSGGGISGALAGLDKSVGNTIPGGWGTVGMIAASMIPGAQFAALGMSKAAAMGGLGALTGSGVLRPGRGFNVQGALMGGATAYGMANLAAGLESAGGGLNPSATDVAAQLGVEGASTGAGSQAAMLAEQAAGMGTEGLANIASSAAPAINSAAAQGINTLAPNAFAYAPSGEMVPSNISPEVTGAMQGVPIQAQPSALSNFGTGVGMQADAMGRGLSNLSGLSGGEGTAAAARAAFTGSGAGITNTAMPILAGGTGLMAIEEQENYLKQQQASGAITNEEYNTQMAQVEAAKEKARESMRANPYQFGNTTATTPEDALRQNPYQFAYGGSVDDEPGMDSLPSSNMPGFAMGGQPRFLSGGGDGLSDDIPAVIGKNQPARLADGEFVVSSDVVSNLGNGSSKAGAKKLYAMMDRVRQQAHGTKKQINKVNANRVLPA